MAAGAGVLAAACGSPTAIDRAARTAPAGSDLGAVEHVVFLMMENRSFDHYFGTYRGVRGFDDHPPGSLGAFSQPDPSNTSRSPVGRQLPFHLDITTRQAECTHDLTHNWLPQHLCRNHGAMDSFVATHTAASYEGPVNGLLTMGYYGRADLPYHYALADAFTLCDGYHCSILGPTHPNRLMSMSGTIDPAGGHGGPVLITSGSPDARFSVNWTTMPEVLEDAGISWKVYTPPGSTYRAGFDGVLLVSDAILPYFSQYSNPVPPSTRRRSIPHSPPPSPMTCGLAPYPVSRGSFLRSATTNTLRPHPPSGLGSSTRSCGRSLPMSGPGRRRSCSSCTTRTTGSSTTCHHRSPLRAHWASTSRPPRFPRTPKVWPVRSVSASGYR